VDELMVASAMYDINDRIKSVRIFAEIMKKINEEKQMNEVTASS
jgi:hypothetical protein